MALPSERLVDAWRQAQAAAHGQKQQVLKRVSEQLGVSLATLYREFEEAGLKKSRKQRTDAGQVSLSLDEARTLSAWMMAAYRANNKKLATMAIALQVLRANGEILAGRVDELTGEFQPLSESACHRALRQYGLHPEQLRRPAASVQQRSLHPNDVWEIDASISTLFYVPEDVRTAGLADMAPEVFYKNKPGNFEKIKRQRLTRYVVTDHTSGAVFAWYVAGGESIANLGESLLEAMREKQGEALFGVPFHLYFDAGSAATKTFRRFLNALQVVPVVHAVGNARATGQVENAHNLVETQFEVGFKYAHVPGIDWINEQARRFCRWFNATREHSRHGKTRLAKWMEITQPQLRLVDIDQARELLTREPKECLVRDRLQVQFKGQLFDVAAVPGVRQGEKLALTVNPLQPGRAWVVLFENGQEVMREVLAVETNEHGFDVSGPLIGREVKAAPDTELDTNRKAIQRHIYNVDTDEQAEQAAKARQLAFAGRIDPYKHLDDLPQVAVLPRRGTHLQLAETHEAQRLLTIPEAALLLRTRIDWQPRHYAWLSSRYPDGVPESAINDLVAELSLNTIERTGGAVC
jgi:glycosyltransferase involved in cell wall biosynthesis